MEDNYPAPILYYSKTTNGFYNNQINTYIPDDKVVVEQAQYEALLQAQSDGKVIQSDANGNPVAVDFVPTPAEIQSANKSKASNLLFDTDWTTIPDVANSSLSNPYLSNVAEFVAYRNQVRGIAVNPPTTPATFPVKPEAKWTTV
jgi:hypothetical protein